MIRKLRRIVRVYRTRKALRKLIELNHDPAIVQKNAMTTLRRIMEEDLQRSATDSSPIPRHSYNKNNFNKLVYREIDLKTHPDLLYSSKSSYRVMRAMLPTLFKNRPEEF